MDSARGAAHAVTDFFQGNPFGTRIGTQIQQATDPTLTSEDWALNITICDLINSSEEGPRDAIRAFRKRLKDYMGKNNQVVVLTLTLLETCVKNCDRRLHHLVSQKEFVQDLVKLIGPKYDPPQSVQEKVLSLIQCWADAFRGQPDLKGVCEIYDELKAKGVEFPMTDLDAMAPIYTPKKSVLTSPVPPATVAPPPQPSPARQQVVYQQQVVHHHRPVVEPGPVHMSPEQLAKLRSEMDIVSGNIQVLREMLSELAPGQEDSEDLQLLQDLYNTCRQMQMRLLELLERVANEEVTSELLLVNDELNNVFSKYDRYMSNRNKDQHQQHQHEREPVRHYVPLPTPTKPPPASVAPMTASAAVDPTPPLIDFGGGAEDKVDLSQQLAAMGVNGSHVSGLPQTTAASSEFDMFNQTRGSSMEQSRQSGSTYYDNTTGLDQTSLGLGTVAQQRSQMYASGAPASAASAQPAAVKESDYKEMEAWLQQQGPTSATGGQRQPDDFDNFLSRRAQAGAGATITPLTTQQQQQKKKDDERMFSL